MKLLLVRAEAEVAQHPDQETKVLWLGPNPVPESLRSRALTVPDDPPLAEGWLAIRRLGDEMIKGRTVKHALDYNGVSLWWFAHYWLIYGAGLSGWDERYRVLRRLLAAVAAGPFDEIVLFSRRADDDLVAHAVATQRRIPNRWAAPVASRIRSRLVLRWRAEALIRLRMVKVILRGFLARLWRKNSLAGRAKMDLLFNTTSWIWDARKGDDRILGSLLKRAEQRGLGVAGLHLDYQRNLGVDTLRHLDSRIVAWESLVTPARALRAVSAARGVARSFGGALPGDVLGVPAASLLSDRMAVLFSARLSDAVLAIQTAQRALAVLRPRCVYIVDAYDIWGRALVVAAREAGIRTVEVQHGIIEENHGGYLHLEGEVAPDHSQRSPFSPIADLIAVHGEAARDALVSYGRFPPSSIRITGSPNIEAARGRQGERGSIREGLGLHGDGIVAVFFGMPNELWPIDDEHVRAALACCQKVPQLKLLLRPHPTDHTNPARYEAAAKAAGVDAPVVMRSAPLDLVLAADIVMSYNSTTALDAMALDRPVIHVNMSGAPDLFNFVEAGGAIPARSEAELMTALVQLSTPDARLAMVPKERAYVSRYYADRDDPAQAILEAGFPEETA